MAITLAPFSSGARRERSVATRSFASIFGRISAVLGPLDVTTACFDDVDAGHRHSRDRIPYDPGICDGGSIIRRRRAWMRIETQPLSLARAAADAIESVIWGRCRVDASGDWAVRRQTRRPGSRATCRLRKARPGGSSSVAGISVIPTVRRRPFNRVKISTADVDAVVAVASNTGDARPGRGGTDRAGRRPPSSTSRGQGRRRLGPAGRPGWSEEAAEDRRVAVTCISRRASAACTWVDDVSPDFGSIVSGGWCIEDEFFKADGPGARRTGWNLR